MCVCVSVSGSCFPPSNEELYAYCDDIITDVVRVIHSFTQRGSVYVDVPREYIIENIKEVERRKRMEKTNSEGVHNRVGPRSAKFSVVCCWPA